MDTPPAAIRPAAVADMFYPASRAMLSTQVKALLDQAPRPPGLTSPKALIAPHAGYIYSGAIAASAYATLADSRETVRRVILLGPSHRVGFTGIALPSYTAFATPLGTVAIDQDAVRILSGRDEFIRDDRPHTQEHALEVQLPFLQSVLKQFQIVPLTLGMVEPFVVADLLDTLWGGPETLIVVSSDLSHYHAYPVAQRIDRASLDQILALDPQLSHEQACGATGINALLLAARRHGLTPHLLDLRNSGDTAGDRSRVVGYAAVCFTPPVSLHH